MHFIRLVPIPAQFRNYGVSWRAGDDWVWLDRQTKAAQVAHRKSGNGIAASGCRIKTSQAVFGLGKTCPDDRQAGVVASARAECFIKDRDRRGRLVELWMNAAIDQLTVLDRL